MPVIRYACSQQTSPSNALSISSEMLPAVLAGGLSSSAAGSCPEEASSREKFRAAHISWLRAQGDTGERARQYFEEAEIDMYLLWTRVMQLGGMEYVSCCDPPSVWPTACISSLSRQPSRPLSTSAQHHG